MQEFFHRFAARIAGIVGSPWAFLVALVTVVAWATSGPLFHFSDTWQLVINTSTTIITFLIVFLIQNTQNRDARALHLKLDELIASTDKARDRLIDLEHCTDDELQELEHEFEKVRQQRGLVKGEGNRGRLSREDESPPRSLTAVR